MDDQFAENTGDVFFYSPELLDPSRPGIENQKNLYDYHNGAVQLVATLDPGTEINRLQISPDGNHAAFADEIEPDVLRQQRLHARCTPTTPKPARSSAPRATRAALPPTGDVAGESERAVHGRRRPGLLRDLRRARAA